MNCIGIVSINGYLISDGAVCSEEEAKKRAERLLKGILNLKPNKHGFVHLRACKVNWSNAHINDERPYCVNLSRVGIMTTTVRRC